MDSRRVRAGNVFFALPGEHTDGQRFVSDAVAAGAAAVVLRDAPSEAQLEWLTGGDEPGVTVLQVTDAGAALLAAARAWRSRWEPLMVGVTGSLAKTSTKEQVAGVLAERWTTLRSEGNENNEIGLPLTLLRLGPEHAAAVVEMGLYVPGEIALLARVARPAIGVVTAVRGVHLTRAGSLDAIEAGKRELVEALPATGTAVLNVDDARVSRMREHTSARILGYGFAAAADVSAEEVEARGIEGMRFVLRLPGERVEVVTPALGRHSVHNALAAAAVGLAAGLDATTIARGLGRGWSAPHRSSLIHAGSWRILDDSYNASPDSMRAALDLLGTLPGRRVAVLGEMLELGGETSEAHRSVGAQAAAVADRLVVVGEAAATIAAGALDAGMEPGRVVVAADRPTALARLLEDHRPGDTLLVKASRGAQLDLLVEALLRAAGDGVAA